MLASGVTAIAGFAALVFSDIRMLRDFGIVTVVDLTVSLLGVMIVLPAALLWAEEHGPFRVRDLLAALRPAAPSRRPVTDDRDDDRFEDLSIGERLAERDRTHPEPVRRPRSRAREQVRVARRDPDVHGPGRAAVRADDPEPAARVSRAARSGKRLPAFAAPSATGDARGRRERLPEGAVPKNAGPVPACDVRAPGRRQRLRAAPSAAARA